MKLDLHYGNAVTGTQRFSRPDLEHRFLRALTNSSGIKMFGLRRIGKSTLRLFAAEYFSANSIPYAYIDCQGLHSLNDLLAKLWAAMPKENGFMSKALGLMTAGPVTIALDALSKGTPYEEKVLSAYWQMISEAIKKALRGNGPKTVLLIDEFSYLIDNMIKRNEQQGKEDADKLLASLREWRGEGMTMLLTGSIGLTGLARKYGLNVEHLNDLQPFTIPELTSEEAENFIIQATSQPSEGRWTPEHTAEFLSQSGVFYPCFLVRGLLEIGVDNPTKPSNFSEIFSERVRPHLHQDFYNQFDRRFASYSDLPDGQQKKLILPALKSVMDAKPSCSSSEIMCHEPFTQVDLALALTMLAEDGFVHFTENAEGERLWKPASRLAALWWKRSRLWA